MAQRCHKNLVEYIVQVITMGLIAGLVFPIASTICLSVYFLARIAYTIGYSKAPFLRFPGHLVSMTMIITLLILSIWAVSDLQHRFNSIQ